MQHPPELPPCQGTPAPGTTPLPQTPLRIAGQPLKTLLGRWRRRAAAALERAEQRITDGFRVPPGGG